MKKYLITSYTQGSEYDKKFFSALELYADYNDAEIKILLTASDYKQDKGLVWSELVPYLVQKDESLNDSLLLLDIRSKASTLDPTSGLDTIANYRGSLVIGAARHCFKSVPRSLKHNSSPRGIWCTGSISEPSYNVNKGGLKANDLHKKGALIVTIEDNNIFHIRQISWNGESFYDLTEEYTYNTAKLNKFPSAVVLGDLHPPFTNSGVLKATKKLLSSLNAGAVIYHDVFDAASISHHVEGKNLTKVSVFNQLPSLKEELRITHKTLKEIYNASPNSDHFIVRSNHDEHLDRYLDEGRFMKDYVNSELALDIASAKLGGTNALQYALQVTNGALPHVFMERDDTLTISGIECSNHGDYGANGKHGSDKQHGLAFSGKIVTGHQHSPSITPYGNVVVGTMTDLSLHYTNDSGTSGWLNTHAIIYPDGNITHIHLIKKL